MDTDSIKSDFINLQNESAFVNNTSQINNKNINDIKLQNPKSKEKSTNDILPSSVKMEIKALELNQDKIPFQDYLRKGYYYYLLWLSMTLGLDPIKTSHLNFCIARDINTSFPGKYLMGFDLEINYIFKRLESIYGKPNMHLYKTVIKSTLGKELNTTEVRIDSYIHDYFRNPEAFSTTLTHNNFKKRIENVPVEYLDEHSSQVWRNYNHDELNKTPYPISMDDIMNGKNISAPTSRHVGLQLLELNGFIPPKFNSKKPKSFAVTFI